MKPFNKLILILISMFLAGCNGGSGGSFTFIQGDPDPGATTAPANTTITAEFSSMVDSNTVTDETFKVESDSVTGRIAVIGTRSVDPADPAIAQFTPASPLNAGETYYVTLTTDIAGRNRLQLAVETSWQFSVALATPPAP